MTRTLFLAAAAAASAFLGACAAGDLAVVPEAPSAQGEFFARLQRLCGRAFEGRVTSAPVEADREMAASRLTMHVVSCTENEVRIPFHAGENRSRTWVVSRTPAGLRLKHIHRHEDGSLDELSNYGGDTAGPGTGRRQEFPADAFSRELFERTGRAVSVPNVWAIEVDPGRTFAYELRRPGRHFRVEFDLSRPVPAPPAAW
ncbi:MAG TPA: hypothetical protein VEZ20_13735 [Allosphingosinicella sp.]|jgi:hypothetical protein|nr:hypothetical protein [Allosphingosinicella sp.]